MAYYSIIVPDDLASQLNQEATDRGVKKSTYITQLLPHITRSQLLF
jgi:hypothetical protein